MNDVEAGQSAKDIVTEAKAKAVDDVDKASTQGQKDDLAKTIAKDLQAAKTLAQEFLTVEVYARARRAAHTAETIEKGNDALRTLVYAAEAAKKGIIVSKTSEGQLLLEKLAEKRFRYATEGASLVVNLADFLTGDKMIVVGGTINPEFEAAFQQGHWAQTYSVHFGEDADYDLLNAIHVPDKFIDLIENYKKEIREDFQNEGKTITDEELNKEVSEKIEE